MTSKSALKNIISSIILQVVTALSGLILPHFFIVFYGSAINGMISSVTQFLSYLALVEAGIGASAIVALYKPIEEKNENERNYILSAAKKFYFQSGVIYILLLMILLFCYPMLTGDQTDRITTILMIIVLAGSNLIDYFLLGKYRVLLSADQKVYVLNNIQSIGTILTIIVSLLLMFHNQDVVLVKFIATAVYACRTFAVIIYVRHHYSNIRFNIKTEKNALPQRWNALFHQIVGVICNNTDIVLITICLGSKSLVEASVYYVYNLAASMFTSLANSLSTAITPTFGNLAISERKEALWETYDNFEFFYFILIFTLYACMYVLLLPFVSIYTAGVNDANYIRPSLVGLFVLMGLVQNIRIPALSMICAYGHYKETQWRALIEAVINLSVSIVLILRLGIAGTVIGTICSYAYRTIDSIIYSRKFFERKVLKTTFIRLGRNALVMILFCYCVQAIGIQIDSWEKFFVDGLILFCSCIILFACVNYIFEHRKFKKHCRELSRIVKAAR